MPSAADDLPAYIIAAVRVVERPSIEFSRDDAYKPGDPEALGRNTAS